MANDIKLFAISYIMISFTALQTMFGKLSQNSTTENLSLGAQLMNIEYRYLLQKYFSNEASYSITTIGSTNQTLTAAPVIGDTSATLTASWGFPSIQAITTFSDGENRLITFTSSSTAITWQGSLVGTLFPLTAALSSGATTATLQTAWAYTSGSYVAKFSSGQQKTVTLTANSTSVSWSGGLSSNVTANFYTSVNTVALTVGGVQTYKLPPDYSKLKTGTLTIGALKWTPREILTRMEWDDLNVFPYYADIPNSYYIYNNQFNLWPIPSTTGNVITFNYKRRIPDLSLADYIMGTVSVSVGGTTVTGSGTSWTTTVSTNNESRWIQFAQPTGDNLWYQIASVDSTTSLTLAEPYFGTTAISGGAYTLGQMPILMEDFHDMLVWKALVSYFSSIVDNSKKRAEFEDSYNKKLELLEEYAGSKSIDVNLGRRPLSRNPNLYSQSFGV